MLNRIGIRRVYRRVTRSNGLGSINYTHILALLINSTEADNVLRGNDALHAMLGSITITGSLLEFVDVEERKTIIETAKEGEFILHSIMATHVCRKTFF